MAGRGWADPRAAGEGVADGGQDADAVLAGGVEVAADGVPVPGGLLGAEPPGYLLLRLRGAQVTFGLVGGGRDLQVIGEAEHVVLPVTQAFQQVTEGLLLTAVHAPDLAQAEDDPRLKAWTSGAAISPGMAGRPWARARLAAWISPCSAWVICTGQCECRAVSANDGLAVDDLHWWKIPWASRS
jgi:hypothetical protein